MPDKFNRPTNPAHALYHDVLSGHLEKVEEAIRDTPELIQGKAVVDGAWSHGGRRCGAEDDVIECLWLLVENGADFSNVGAGTLDSAFKTHPRGAILLFANGANANAVDGDGLTILHRMVEIGYRRAVRVLLDHGADVKAKTPDGTTPLDIAGKRGLKRMARFLQDHGGGSEPIDGDDPQLQSPEKKFDPKSGLIAGQVAWYRADRGYGYLSESSLSESLWFFDEEDFVAQAPDGVEEGTPLSFQLARDKFGLRAIKIAFAPADAP